MLPLLQTNKHEFLQILNPSTKPLQHDFLTTYAHDLTFYTATLASLLTFFACLAKVVPNHDYGNRQFQNNKTCTFMPLLIDTVYRLGQ